MSLAKSELKKYIEILKNSKAPKEERENAERIIRSQTCSNNKCKKPLSDSTYLFYCPKCVALLCEDLKCLTPHSGHGVFPLQSSITIDNKFRGLLLGIGIGIDSKDLFEP